MFPSFDIIQGLTFQLSFAMMSTHLTYHLTLKVILKLLTSDEYLKTCLKSCFLSSIATTEASWQASTSFNSCMVWLSAAGVERSAGGNSTLIYPNKIKTMNCQKRNSWSISKIFIAYKFKIFFLSNHADNKMKYKSTHHREMLTTSNFIISNFKEFTNYSI